MSQESITLSVRLRHASMTPDEISPPMGVQPTAVHAVGDQRKSPAGKDLGGTYAETYWVYKLLQRREPELERAIADANAWLVQRESFLQSFSRSGGSVECYASVTCDNRLAIELTPDLLAECTRLGVRLSVEVFCS